MAYINQNICLLNKLFIILQELSNSEAGSIMGSPTGEHSDVTTAVSMRRPSIVGTRESTRSKKQKTNTRLQLPGIQPTTSGESIAASGL